MKRPLTTSFSAPEPSAPETEAPAATTWRELAPVVAALVAELEILEVSPTKGPALRAHRSTMRRLGEAAAAAGGPEAMREALEQVADADPNRANRRSQVINEAWSGLPGWEG